MQWANERDNRCYADGKIWTCPPSENQLILLQENNKFPTYPESVKWLEKRSTFGTVSLLSTFLMVLMLTIAIVAANEGYLVGNVKSGSTTVRKIDQNDVKHLLHIRQTLPHPLILPTGPPIISFKYSIYPTGLPSGTTPMMGPIPPQILRLSPDGHPLLPRLGQISRIMKQISDLLSIRLSSRVWSFLAASRTRMASAILPILAVPLRSMTKCTSSLGTRSARALQGSLLAPSDPLAAQVLGMAEIVLLLLSLKTSRC